MSKRCYLLFIFLFFIVNIARATVVPNLSIAIVPVSDTSISARQQAMSKGLKQVLVKMSGNPSIATLSSIENAFDNVDAYIQNYSYSRQINANGSSQLTLQISFDRKALKQLLSKAGQSDWSQDRPLTLLWFQIQDGNNVQVLSNISDAVLSKAVIDVAKSRGVPVVFPAMDLQDQSFIKADQTEFQPSSLQQVVTRYGAAALLAGHIQHEGNKWEGQWLLLVNDTPFQWHNESDSLVNLSEQTINNMTNLMADQLASVDDKALQTDVTVDVSNVVGLDDYAKVLSALRHISSVSSVSVIDMEGSDMLLKIKMSGGSQALSNAIASLKGFTLINTSDDANAKADLFYRWASKHPAESDNQVQIQNNE